MRDLVQLDMPALKPRNKDYLSDQNWTNTENALVLQICSQVITKHTLTNDVFVSWDHGQFNKWLSLDHPWHSKWVANYLYHTGIHDFDSHRRNYNSIQCTQNAPLYTPKTQHSIVKNLKICSGLGVCVCFHMQLRVTYQMIGIEALIDCVVSSVPTVAHALEHTIVVGTIIPVIWLFIHTFQ